MARVTLSGLPASDFQLIIAGGGEDATPAELLDWVSPVLRGVEGGLWLSCEVNPGGRGTLSARMRNGAMAPHLALCASIPRGQARRLRRLLPKPAPFAVVLLNDHAAQVMALLDGMAMWLNVFEADDPSIIPILDMLALWRRPEKIAAAS